MTKVIEQFSLGKHQNQLLNEDGLYVSEQFVAVIDGVTSKTTAQIWKPSPGVIATHTLINSLSSLDEKSNYRNAQKHLDAAIRNQYTMIPGVSESYFKDNPNERLQANIVLYSHHHKQIWLFGDCQAMINGTLISHTKHIDILLSELRSFIFQAHFLSTSEQNRNIDNLSSTSYDDFSRKAIMPYLRMQSLFANQRGDFGYFVFDGYTDYNYPLQVFDVKAGDEIILASDGYPQLKTTLEESEHVLNQLRINDPHLTTIYKATKGFEPRLNSFDDRTYIRFIA